MFLKTIELFGFKSFPDRTKIDFQNDGIAVILGPNGCGKSNIVDAVKWVIGEQSSKTLRAGRMEDVIFSGTENRKPLNVAEVTLILSNDQGILSLDLPEIAIKRRLYRSGESEYYVNRSLVRLKEMKELFYDTGVGKSSYSVMEQGEIDRILSSKPEERRSIFEEAAGITKYKVKRVEAERKLERTEENMRQVSGILTEVKRSYDTLKVQSEKTEVFRDLKEKIFEDELRIQTRHLSEFLKKKDRAEQTQAALGRTRKQLEEEMSSVDSSMRSAIEAVNRMESRLIDVQKTLYGIDIERDHRGSQIKILEERIGELEKKIQEDEMRAQRAREKMASLDRELDQKGQSLERTVKQLEEIRCNIEGFQKDIELFSQSIERNDEAVTRSEETIGRLEESIEAYRVDLREITDDIVTQLDEKLKEMGYSHTEHRELETEIDDLIESVRIQIEGKRALVSDASRIDGGREKERERVLQTVGALFDEVLAKTQRLLSLWGRFKRATPTFLDEFLAPKGIITRKRSIDSSINEAREKILSTRREIERYREENRNLTQKIDEYRRTLEELRVSRARTEAQKSAAQGEIERLSGEKEEQVRFLERNREERGQTERSIQDIRDRVSRLQKERDGLAEKEKELKADLGKLEKEISEQNDSVVAQESSLKEKREELSRVHQELEASAAELAEIRTEIRNLRQNFAEKHSRDLPESPDAGDGADKTGPPLRDLQRRLAKHREEMKSLGHVNLMAPEEFKEIKERYEFLQSQLQDLTQAREDLRRITDEIKVESSELFLKTYEQIRKNFHLMVRRLFGGGRAELKLLDEENVLESGIGIYAQPPGKKLENINLLSGGERSLTAVALLFAIYLSRPSPFCILDEIDAALDEQNIERFVSLLKEFSDRTQFILVTHNKRTIAGAETLLGITMEESGVSKIIATRIKGNGRSN